MVSASYKEITPVQEVDFTATAGKSQLELSQIAQQVSSKAGDKLLQMAKIKAQQEGMAEGLKGEKAQSGSNWTPVGQAFNAGLQSTLATTLGAQVSSHLSSEFLKVQQRGFKPEDFVAFQQTTKTYIGAMQDRLDPEIAKTAIPAMQKLALNYQGQFTQGNIKARLNSASINDAELFHTGVNSVLLQTGSGNWITNQDNTSKSMGTAVDHMMASQNITASKKLSLLKQAYTGWASSIVGKNFTSMTTSQKQEVLKDPQGFLAVSMSQLAQKDGRFLTYTDQSKLASSFTKNVNSYNTLFRASAHGHSEIVDQLKLKAKTFHRVSESDAIKAADSTTNELDKAYVLSIPQVQEMVQTSLGNPEQEELIKKNLINGKTPWSAKSNSYGLKVLEHYQNLKSTDPGAFNQEVFRNNSGREHTVQIEQENHGTDPALTNAALDRLTNPDLLVHDSSDGAQSTNLELQQRINSSVNQVGTRAGISNGENTALSSLQINRFANKLNKSTGGVDSKRTMWRNLKANGHNLINTYAQLDKDSQTYHNFLSMMLAHTGENTDAVRKLTTLPQWAEVREGLSKEDKTQIDLQATVSTEQIRGLFPPPVADQVVNVVKTLAATINSGVPAGTLGHGLNYVFTGGHSEYLGLLSPGSKSPSGMKIILGNVLKTMGLHVLDDHNVAVPLHVHPPGDNSITLQADPRKINQYLNQLTNQYPLYYTDVSPKNTVIPTSAMAALTELIPGVAAYFHIKGGLGYSTVTTPLEEKRRAYNQFGLQPTVVDDGANGYKVVGTAYQQIFWEKQNGQKGKPIKGTWFDLINKLTSEK